MSKTLYGLLKSSLDFYNKLRADLEGNGFIINPYDPCMANKMVNDKEMTVIWHVDCLKVSHVDENEKTKFTEWMKASYGKKITIRRGKNHDYLHRHEHGLFEIWKSWNQHNTILVPGFGRIHRGNK